MIAPTSVDWREIFSLAGAPPERRSPWHRREGCTLRWDRRVDHHKEPQQDLGATMTVGELRARLGDAPDDMPVVIYNKADVWDDTTGYAFVAHRRYQWKDWVPTGLDDDDAVAVFGITRG